MAQKVLQAICAMVASAAFASDFGKSPASNLSPRAHESRWANSPNTPLLTSLNPCVGQKLAAILHVTDISALINQLANVSLCVGFFCAQLFFLFFCRGHHFWVHDFWHTDRATHMIRLMRCLMALDTPNPAYSPSPIQHPFHTHCACHLVG